MIYLLIYIFYNTSPLLSEVTLPLPGLTMRGPGMMYEDFLTQSDTGQAFCLVLFYSVYPVLSVNINTYCLLVLNQFLAIKSPLTFNTRGTRQWVLVKRAIVATWVVASAYLGIYLTIIYTKIGKL